LLHTSFNYANDLVICCRDRAEEALAIMPDVMRKLKLTVNETKTLANSCADCAY
jgi:hypothetical protein